MKLLITLLVLNYFTIYCTSETNVTYTRVSDRIGKYPFIQKFIGQNYTRERDNEIIYSFWDYNDTAKYYIDNEIMEKVYNKVLNWPYTNCCEYRYNPDEALKFCEDDCNVYCCNCVSSHGPGCKKKEEYKYRPELSPSQLEQLKQHRIEHPHDILLRDDE